MLDDYGSIANDLLEAAGYSLYGEKLDDNVLGCTFRRFCQQYYKDEINSIGCDKNNCRLLADLKSGNISNEIREELSKNLNIPKTHVSEEGISLVCPRSLQAKASIHENCSNKKCHFFSPKMAFSCILLHSKTFFPDEDIPRRVIEVATNLSPRILDRYNKLSIYLIRIYLILLKYSMENLKVDYSLTFQTSYIYELLKSSNSRDIIECCPNCGAYVSETLLVKHRVKNYNQGYLAKDYKCDCMNHFFLEERQKRTQEWLSLLEKAASNKNIDDYSKLSYKKFYSKYKSLLFSKELILHLISKLNINNLRLSDIPLGFVLKSYTEMFGELDPGNFGLSPKACDNLYNLFVERRTENG